MNLCRNYKWAKEIKNPNLENIIKPFAYAGRSYIYKPAYIYVDHNTSESNVSNKFFRSLLKCSYKALVEKSKKLTELLKPFIPNIQDYDIILERTPLKDSEQYLLDGFKIYNSRKKRFDDHPKGLESINNYLSLNKQAYIFCTPLIYEDFLKFQLDSNTDFQKLLSEV